MKNPNMPAIPLRNPLVHLNNSRANGSPLRRSILIAPPAIINNPANNDEAERRQRRNNVEIQRLSSVGLNRSMTGDNSELSVSKMQDHFEQCVRLFAENKINSKNAWNLQIIEYMRKLLDRDQFEMGDSLQIASTSLDIGSKVYGLRVDDIHNEIMKLASNMARINLEHDVSADNVSGDGPESDTEAAAAQQKKKRKKRLSGGDENSQLVANEDSITGHLPTSAFYNRQESSSQRLYTLSALQTLKCGDEQLVSCRGKVPYWSALAESIIVRPMSGLVPVTLPPATGTICPSFTDFSVDVWNPEDDLDISQAAPHAEEVVYDEDGFPVPELDRSLHNFDDADPLDDVEEEFAGEPHADANREVAYITDMRPGTQVSGRLEYSYREPPVISERYMLTGVWAGPSHWKVKCLQRTATATIVKNARVVRKRAPRAPPAIITFDMPDDELQRMSRANKSRFVKTLQEEYRITYPEDMRITRSEIRALFLKPDVYLGLEQHPEEDALPLDDSITNYEFDNPNDAEYCNETLRGDDADSDNDAHAEAAEVDESCFMEDNMVNVPNLVQKSHVAYATQAKKVDMKKLKRAMIRTMARLDAQNAAVNDEEMENCTVSKVSFCAMYNALPNELNTRMAEEISCPLAYVALLHLCNERNLQLDGQEDLLDVLISSN